MFLFLAGAKLLRIQMAFPSYVPEPLPIEGMLFREEEVPEQAKSAMEPLEQEMLELGFRWPVYHGIREPLVPTIAAGRAMLSPDGQTLGKILYVRQVTGQRVEETLICAFVTFLESGRIVVTGTKSPGFAPGPGYITQRLKTKSPRVLYEAHQKLLAGLKRETARTLPSYERYLEALGDYENSHTRENIERGVYALMEEGEVESIRAAQVVPGTVPVEGEAGGPGEAGQMIR